MPKATTIRFSDEVYARLDQASARTGMPVNSIVVAACLEWMQRHTPAPEQSPSAAMPVVVPTPSPPRWSTIRRAVKVATARPVGSAPYPFERFTGTAQNLLTAAQKEVEKSGHNYIGTEHLLLAAFALPESQSSLALASLGVEEETVRAKLAELLGPGKRTIVRMVVPTTRVKKVIDLAFTLCATAGDPRVSTGHILLALSSEGEGIAARVLKDLGAPVERIESALEEITEPET